MKNKEKDTLTDLKDDKFRQLLKANLPYPPVTPWFTKLVLNRLPEKGRAIAGMLELIISFAGFILTAVWGVKYVIATLNAQLINLRVYSIYMVYLVIAAVLAYNIADALICRKNAKTFLSPERNR